MTLMEQIYNTVSYYFTQSSVDPGESKALIYVHGCLEDEAERKDNCNL